MSMWEGGGGVGITDFPKINDMSFLTTSYTRDHVLKLKYIYFI